MSSTQCPQASISSLPHTQPHPLLLIQPPILRMIKAFVFNSESVIDASNNLPVISISSAHSPFDKSVISLIHSSLHFMLGPMCPSPS
mmetsp:Transcript_4635/g.10501  ORF Transcript_4635/g.10501 Transcript_4635/m.10501 type:complete len:87 (+) Transcript_4635:72-332(+)